MKKILKIIKLKPIDQTGFCFDKKFVDEVKRFIHNKKQKEQIDEKLCAIVVAQFLANYELKDRDIN